MMQASVGPTVDHATYIGGSDIGALAGLSERSTALDVWAEKTGRKKWDGNALSRAGQHFERPILDFYRAERGAGELTYPGTLLRGITGATPDALDICGRCIQVKMVGNRQAMSWGPEHLGSEGIPVDVYAQVHFEAWHVWKVLGAFSPDARVVAQMGTEQRVYVVDLDYSFATDLVGVAESFWRDHIERDQMPEVADTSREMLQIIYRSYNRGLLEMPESVLSFAKVYAAARAEEKDAKNRKEAIGQDLCALIGQSEGFYAGDQRKPDCKVTWSAQRGKVDWETYAKELGGSDEGAEKFRRESSRVLRVALKGEKNDE